VGALVAFLGGRFSQNEGQGKSHNDFNIIDDNVELTESIHWAEGMWEFKIFAFEISFDFYLFIWSFFVKTMCNKSTNQIGLLYSYIPVVAINSFYNEIIL
jgi:hypothetical protein